MDYKITVTGPDGVVFEKTINVPTWSGFDGWSYTYSDVDEYDLGGDIADAICRNLETEYEAS